jgi:lipoate-protein ligase B
VNQDVLYFDLGLAEYQDVYTLQKRLTDNVAEKTFQQSLLLLEHPPVYTMGKSGSEKSLLKHVPVVRVDRGGDITYHGPGQLIGYPILILKTRKVSQYIQNLEESLILLLHQYSIRGETKKGYPGVWVRDQKIASLGVRIKKGVSYHGFALNVTVELDAFQCIKPCGLDITMTSMEDVLSREIFIQDVKEQYVRAFETVFGVKVKKGDNNLLSSFFP